MIRLNKFNKDCYNKVSLFWVLCLSILVQACLSNNSKTLSLNGEQITDIGTDCQNEECKICKMKLSVNGPSVQKTERSCSMYNMSTQHGHHCITDGKDCYTYHELIEMSKENNNRAREKKFLDFCCKMRQLRRHDRHCGLNSDDVHCYDHQSEPHCHCKPGWKGKQCHETNTLNVTYICKCFENENTSSIKTIKQLIKKECDSDKEVTKCYKTIRTRFCVCGTMEAEIGKGLDVCSFPRNEDNTKKGRAETIKSSGGSTIPNILLFFIWWLIFAYSNSTYL